MLYEHLERIPVSNTSRWYNLGSKIGRGFGLPIFMLCYFNACALCVTPKFDGSLIFLHVGITWYLLASYQRSQAMHDYTNNLCPFVPGYLDFTPDVQNATIPPSMANDTTCVTFSVLEDKLSFEGTESFSVQLVVPDQSRVPGVVFGVNTTTVYILDNDSK